MTLPFITPAAAPPSDPPPANQSFSDTPLDNQSSFRQIFQDASDSNSESAPKATEAPARPQSTDGNTASTAKTDRPYRKEGKPDKKAVSNKDDATTAIVQVSAPEPPTQPVAPLSAFFTFVTQAAPATDQPVSAKQTAFQPDKSVATALAAITNQIPVVPPFAKLAASAQPASMTAALPLPASMTAALPLPAPMTAAQTPVQTLTAPQPTTKSGANAAVALRAGWYPMPQPPDGNAPVADTGAFGTAANSGQRDSLTLNAAQAPEAAAPALSANTLAFAMRLGAAPQAMTAAQNALSQNAAAANPTVQVQIGSTANNTSPSLTALASGLGAAMQAAGAGTSESTSERSHSEGGESGGNAAASYAVPLNDAGQQPSSNDFSLNQPGTVSGVSTLDDNLNVAGNADPVKNVLLQLKGEDNRRVDVRLVDRGGELQVSVKSGDMELAQRLQQHMPELTSRLSEGRVSAEVWMPKLAESSRSESGSSSGFAGSDTNADSGSQSGSGGGQRHNGQSQSRPDWVDLLENQIS